MSLGARCKGKKGNEITYRVVRVEILNYTNPRLYRDSNNIFKFR